MSSLPSYSRLYTWLLAARPKTLGAAFCPVASTVIFLIASGGEISWLYAAFILLTACILQIAANLSNDFIDFSRGADTSARKGPLRLAQSGLLTEKELKRATVGLLGIALILGIPLALKGGVPILLIGLSALYFAIGYSGGPFPLAYLGLGEVATFLFFGLFATCGTSLILASHISLPIVVLGFSSGALSSALLTINNWRDISEDSLTSKKTLAVRFGAKFARREYQLFLLSGVCTPALASGLSSGGRVLLAPLILLPVVGWLVIRAEQAEEVSDLIGLFAPTGLMLFLFPLALGFPLLLGLL